MKEDASCTLQGINEGGDVVAVTKKGASHKCPWSLEALTFLLVCFHRTNDQLVAFLSRYRDMNFLKSHGRDNAR